MTSEYPRPQLVREQWQDLCGDWGFAFDDADEGMAAGWAVASEPYDRSIVVPYPFESKLSGIGDPSRHPVVWYRRLLSVSVPGDGSRVLLHFGAVDYRASVWVGGQLVGTHEGGHTSFSFDVTSALDPSGTSVLVVRAEDPSDDPTQPRGKQDWQAESHGIWYSRTTGIWQPVWCEVVPAAHVDELVWVPDVAGGSVHATVRVAGVASRVAPGSLVSGASSGASSAAGPSGTSAGGSSGTSGGGAPLSLRVRLSARGSVVAEQTVAVLHPTIRLDLALPGARHGQARGHLLWSPESPNLIDAEVTLLGADGDVVDAVSSYLGFRDVAVRDGRFQLNEHPYFLRLALEQGFWPESHLTAPDDDALHREVELAKELGFNGVRVHQKIENPRFLYWCDRLGLLVWEEMPSAYEFDTVAVERVVREWTEAVRRDRSHPCIVAWVPLNESWGVPHIEVDEEQQHYARALFHLTHALDPTRPVISNDGWEHTDSDIWGVHDYAAFGDSLRSRYDGPEAVRQVLTDRRPGRRRVVLGVPTDRGQPVMLTEFGGLSYSPAAGENWFGYATVDSAEEYEERVGGLVAAILDNPEIAGFCYTQLTDTEQERNGLVTEDREPKLPVEALHRILTRPAAAVPPEQIDASRRVASRAAEGTRAQP